MALDERTILEAFLAELQTRRDQVQGDKEYQETKVEADETEIERLDICRNAVQEYLDTLP
jgi:hypothetical protein